jgi:hypothetical protein
MMIRVATELSMPAEKACELAQKPAVFRHVIWPAFTVGAVPDRLEVGNEISARLYFFGCIPAWKHRLKLVSVDPCAIYSNEYGGPVSTWNHRLTFEPTSESTCRYTDEVEIEAGIATLPTVLVAHLIYRWRQYRWRRLACLVG